jgi:hypothetical protein
VDASILGRASTSKRSVVVRPRFTATGCAAEPAPEPESTPAPDTGPPATDACTRGYSPRPTARVRL